MAGILHGTAYGSDQEAIINHARQAAATYFSVDPDVVRVELDNEHVDELTFSQGGERLNVGFAADFRAVVL